MGNTNSTDVTALFRLKLGIQLQIMEFWLVATPRPGAKAQISVQMKSLQVYPTALYGLHHESICHLCLQCS